MCSSQRGSCNIHVRRCSGAPGDSAERRLSGTPIAFILLLSYTSSCVNPIIYCFMNKRFRLGFLATFPCCPNPGPPGARGEVGDEVDLSKLKRRPDSIEATQWAPRDLRRDLRGERHLL